MSGWRRRPGTAALMPVAGPGFHGQVHVREDGSEDGPALVLLHGFSGSMHTFAGVVGRLADSFRIVRVDLLGHGATGGNAADAPAQARMVDAVLAGLGLDDVTAVGHSFGADVAVELAERSPRVTGLVIVAQAPDYSDATLPRANVIMTLPVLSTLLHRGAQVLAGVAGALAARRDPERRELAAQAVADFRAVATAMFRVVLIERRDRMARRPLDDQVREAGKPTLVILGERDHFYGARSAARYERAGAQVTVLPESGHSPIIDLPDRTADLIRSFVLSR